MLVEFLVRYSPAEAVASIAEFPNHRRHALLQLIFTHWSSSNIHEALSAMTNLRSVDRHVAINTIIVESSDASSQELISAKLRLNSDLDLVEWQQERDIHEIMDQDPFQAIDWLANDTIDDSRQIDLYRQIVERWYQYEGCSIITQLEGTGLSGDVYDELFEQITEKDRVSALDFINSVDDSLQKKLGYRLIENWVKDDAESAFLAVKYLPKSSFRNSMLRKVAADWGRKDPSIVMDRLLEFPRLYRSVAIAAIASEFALEDPKSALDRMEHLRSVPGTYVDRAVQSIIRTWSTEAPTLALEWVQSHTKVASKTRTELLSEVLSKYALVAPKQAMDIAVEEFSPKYYVYDLERRVLSSLLSDEQLDTAIGLLDRVRDEIRKSASIEIGTELVKQDRISDALNLGDQLFEEQRIDYFNSLAWSLIRNNTSKFFDLMPQLPSNKLQSDLAEQILDSSSLHRYLSSDQLKVLQSYLPD